VHQLSNAINNIPGLANTFVTHINRSAVITMCIWKGPAPCSTNVRFNNRLYKFTIVPKLPSGCWNTTACSVGVPFC